jgi:hypothetical protein
MGGSRRTAVEAFYKNFLESSLEEEIDGKINILIATVAMVNDHYLMTACRGG